MLSTEFHCEVSGEKINTIRYVNRNSFVKRNESIPQELEQKMYQKQTWTQSHSVKYPHGMGCFICCTTYYGTTSLKN
jgi:hypothetical protein